MTFLVSELSLWLLWGMGKVSSPHPEWYANFHILTLTLSALVNGMLLRLFLAKHALTRHIAAEARAKLQALQSRIRPHFVFNSLNIIAALTRSAPEKAEAALEDIADLFRMMLSQDDMLVPVRNEIDIAKKYIAARDAAARQSSAGRMGRGHVPAQGGDSGTDAATAA